MAGILCECGKCQANEINHWEYEELAKHPKYMDFSLNYFIVLQTHVHRIPNKLEIIDRTISLFLVNIEID